MGVLNFFYLLYILICLFIFFISYLKIGLIFNDSFLLASSSNNDDDFMQYIDFGDSNSSNGGDPSGSPAGDPSDHEDKKDTDRLYEYLKPYEGKWIKDTQINLKKRHFDYSSASSDEKVFQMSRIFAHVKKENPSFFTRSEYSHPVDTRLTKDFLGKISSLKKNYSQNWPSK